MKKAFASLAFVAAMGMGFSAFAAKEAAKETTVKGTAKCAKCSLKEADKCQATVVTADGTKYAVKGKAGDALHKEICTKDKENVTVTGTVSEKDGKKVIEATKVE